MNLYVCLYAYAPCTYLNCVSKNFSRLFVNSTVKWQLFWIVFGTYYQRSECACKIFQIALFTYLILVLFRDVDFFVAK